MVWLNYGVSKCNSDLKTEHFFDNIKKYYSRKWIICQGKKGFININTFNRNNRSSSSSTVVVIIIIIKMENAVEMFCWVFF